MREARLILPAGPGHKRLRAELAGAFGGFTAQPEEGGWVDPQGHLIEEPGTSYYVALEDTPDNVVKLRTIARRIGHAAKQQAMYVRLPNGEVEILNVEDA